MTDKQAHTAGPWGYYGDPNDEPWLAHRGALEAAPGITIGTPTHTEPIARFSGYLMDAVANAKRATAAVNACEGIPTEALESGVVADLLVACEAVVNAESRIQWPMSPWIAELHAVIAKAKSTS